MRGTRNGAGRSPLPKALTIAIAIALSGCGGSDNEPEVMSHAEPVMHWNSMLASLDPEAPTERFAAIVSGLDTVELLERRPDGGFAVRAIRAPARLCAINIAAADVDGDGALDLLVSDACGDWIARQLPDGGFSPVAWTELLPEVPGHHGGVLQVDELTGRGPPEIHSSGILGTTVLSRDEGEWRGLHLNWESRQFRSHGMFTRQLAPASMPEDGPGAMILTSRRRLYDAAWLPQALLEQSGTRNIEEELVPLTQDELEYTVPFRYYDHLGAFPAGAGSCANAVLGVGVFPSQAYTAGGEPAPRRVQRVRIEDGSLIASDLPVPSHVTAAFVASERIAGQVVVVALRRTAQGQEIWLLGSEGCDEFDVLAQSAVELDRTTARLPEHNNDLRPRVEKKDGVIFLSDVSDDGELVFLHYDGFQVFEFRTSPERSWEIAEQRWRIHEERSDLAD